MVKDDGFDDLPSQRNEDDDEDDDKQSTISTRRSMLFRFVNLKKKNQCFYFRKSS